MAKAIKVENLSKAYQLGEIGTGTISRDIERWWAKTRGKEDPFLKIGEANDRSVKGKSNITWSLKDINFEIEQGDAVGIIGRNGAGKSTLLKILSRVTSPTTGSIKVKGRIASLLEVGTGFHPELTGKENIFLNGAILGMRKKEIARKFDEIVDFAGVQRYIDTPVKRYSSGMYVRLAFAVAAYLESETLIVDEVLAVGDAEFQKKCLGKMKDVSIGEGRTVLFVSHNMNAVKNLCSSGIVLDKGNISYAGDIEDSIEEYERLFYAHSSKFESSFIAKSDKDDGKSKILGIHLKDQYGVSKSVFDMFESIYISILYKIAQDLKGSVVTFSINNSVTTVLLTFDTDENQSYLDFRPSGTFEARICIPATLLKPGEYYLNFNIGIANINILDRIDNQIGFKIDLKSKNDAYLGYAEKRPGIIGMPLTWKTSKIS